MKVHLYFAMKAAIEKCNEEKKRKTVPGRQTNRQTDTDISKQTTDYYQH